MEAAVALEMLPRPLVNFVLRSHFHNKQIVMLETVLIICLLCDLVGAGADFVMLGGMLAGHDQCAGEVIEKDGKKFKLFYGMSSDTAMKKYVGGVAEYR